jgi:hypothetical protein
MAPDRPKKGKTIMRKLIKRLLEFFQSVPGEDGQCLPIDDPHDPQWTTRYEGERPKSWK